MSLYGDFLNNKDRPIHKSLNYFPVYERHFSRYINQPLTMIEIGTGGGGSSQMWRRYFGSFARIVSLDIREECKAFEDAQVSIRIGDQSDTVFLQAVLDEFGPPDIVLDDGSHVMRHVVDTFAYLYPRTARNGVYMVEDMHTAYWDEYGGGLRRPDTFIEICKGLVDELNADHTRGAMPPTAFGKETVSMHFYDSIVCFERGLTPSKASVVTGDATQRIG